MNPPDQLILALQDFDENSKARLLGIAQVMSSAARRTFNAYLSHHFFSKEVLDKAFEVRRFTQLLRRYFAAVYCEETKNGIGLLAEYSLSKAGLLLLNHTCCIAARNRSPEDNRQLTAALLIAGWAASEAYFRQLLHEAPVLNRLDELMTKLIKTSKHPSSCPIDELYRLQCAFALEEIPGFCELVSELRSLAASGRL
ncbi:MAG: hypothetical protein QXY39_04190, partial [Thermofilaceae archaeon]